jgi:hypothetical protein
LTCVRQKDGQDAYRDQYRSNIVPPACLRRVEVDIIVFGIEQLRSVSPPVIKEEIGRRILSSRPARRKIIPERVKAGCERFENLERREWRDADLPCDVSD